jgi:hypothetical protein
MNKQFLVNFMVEKGASDLHLIKEVRLFQEDGDSYPIQR